MHLALQAWQDIVMAAFISIMALAILTILITPAATITIHVHPPEDAIGVMAIVFADTIAIITIGDGNRWTDKKGV